MKTSTPITLLAAIVITACGSNSGTNPTIDPEVVGPVTNIMIDDGANTGNASDLHIAFQAPNQPGISGFRVFFVKTAQAAAFNLAVANAVAAGRFTPATAANGTSGFSPASAATDTDQDPIAEGQSYRLFILSVATAGPTLSALANLPQEFELTRNTIVRTLLDRIDAGTGGVSVGPDGDIYVADSGPLPGLGGSTVYRVTPTGESSVFASGPPLVTALGGAWDSSGRYYQASFGGNAVLRIDAAGAMTNFASVGIASPVGLAFDPDDNLYVANCGDNTVRRVRPDGTSEPFAASPLFNCPNGIIVGPGGNVYVANFNDGAMLQVTPTGEVSLFATLEGGNLGHIAFGNDVFYVTARGAHRIYTVTLDGTTTVLAGSGAQGTDEGSAGRASLSLPNGIAISADGSTLFFNQARSSQGGANAPTQVRAVQLGAGG